jgi:hypothetical protein
MSLTVEESRLKKILKSAVVEALEERPDLVSEAVAAAVEDIAMTRAIREGAETETVERSEVFRILRKKR